MLESFERTFVESTDEFKITDFTLLLYALDCIIHAPPAIMNVPGQPAEPIGVPIYVLMDPLINTGAGYLLFTSDAFNKAIKPLLDCWGRYLITGDSNKTLTDKSDGWFGEEGLKLLEADDRGIFNDTYITPDPDATNRGYKSWDECFTRKVQPGARPIEQPRSGQKVIYNACESTVERYATGVQLHDKFWLKGMPYSLYDMFGVDKAHESRKAIAEKFVGGTVYQAFLSPEDYHCWNAPVAGTIAYKYNIEGTYYAALPDDGDDGDMRGALIRSQPWLTVAATRAIIVIDTSKTINIGYVCLIAVGMVEVSTCQITVEVNDPVEPDTQLGMFHFGGSSHALLFEKKAIVSFRNPVKPGVHRKVHSTLADVTTSQE
ncbi:hypothetical protein FRC09_019412 [Ceratobasidium sp. 395]|nr:hypothetical protein FRC09_019412 [Ceratobasidium sp. 395]